MKNNKKSAAMFGLDARIALAIFGALSIITGAALYSVLNNVNIVKIKNEVNEITKGIEQFYLDTGRPPSSFAGVPYLNLNEIVDGSSIQGWRGPYLDYALTLSTTDYQLKYPTGGQISLEKNRDATWAAWTASGADCPVGYTGGCSFYIWICDAFDDETILKLENQIDQTVNPAKGTDMTGDFRYVTGSNTRAVFRTISYPKEFSK